MVNGKSGKIFNLNFKHYFRVKGRQNTAHLKKKSIMDKERESRECSRRLAVAQESSDPKSII